MIGGFKETKIKAPSVDSTTEKVKYSTCSQYLAGPHWTFGSSLNHEHLSMFRTMYNSNQLRNFQNLESQFLTFLLCCMYAGRGIEPLEVYLAKFDSNATERWIQVQANELPWCTYKLLYFGVTLLWKLLWVINRNSKVFQHLQLSGLILYQFYINLELG